jgi:hypothetical protein
MNLGHGRAGHLPDYSFMKYEYLPAWGGYRVIVKDNPEDYLHAFAQMIEAMKYLRGTRERFEKNRYDWEAIGPWREEIETILRKRQPDACEDWKALGEKISGREIEEFEIESREAEYLAAGGKDREETFLGRFFLAALRQKSMVTASIYRSGSRLAGISVDFTKKGFRGIRDFRVLTERRKEEGKHD